MFYLLLLLSITCFIFVLPFKYYEGDELKPCPEIHPDNHIRIHELKGRWHLSVLVLDAANEDLEESEVCVTGEIILTNNTHMKQVWDMYTPNHPDEPVGTMELSVTVLDHGIWSVQTPLGAQLRATVFGYDTGCVMVAHCGWHRGKLVHLWTAGVTRENLLTPDLRIKLSSLLLENGYEPSTTKIITWSKC